MRLNEMIIAMVATAFVASCSNDDEIYEQDRAASAEISTIETDTVTVEDGIPCYATDDVYFHVGSFAANLAPANRIEWEKSLGFTSMFTFAESVIGKGVLGLGEAYGRPEVFSVSEDSVVDIEVPLVLASIANSNGYFRIGDKLCKVDRYRMVAIENGSKTDVDEALESGVIPDNQSGCVRTLSVKSSTLKATTTEKRITELSGSIHDNHDWMDYSIKVRLITDSKNPIEQAEIFIEQRSKNYEKKRRRWREHRCANYYRSVRMNVVHPSIPLNSFGFHAEWLSTSDYFGKSDLVNHSLSESVKHFYRGPKFEISAEQPYMTGLNGSAGSDDINNTVLDLYNFYLENSNK